MKKTTVAIGALAISLSAGLAANAVAQSMDQCTSEAGRTRYATEMDCYESYGPKSGRWSVQEQGALNTCLDAVNWDYSEKISGCQELYAVEDTTPPLDPKKATSGALGIIGAIFGILAF